MNKQNLIYIFAAIIVFAGLIIGFFLEKEEKKAPEVQSKIEEKEKVVPAPKKEPEQPLKKEDEKGKPMDNLGEVDILDIPESERNYVVEESPNLSNFFSDVEVMETKEVGESFVRAVHEFNGENPTENIQNAELYSTAELYKRMIGNEAIVRPTKEFFKRTVTNIEMREPRNATSDYIMWEARVMASVYDENGDKVADVLTVYLLKFNRVDGVYKVSDYATNITYY